MTVEELKELMIILVEEGKGDSNIFCRGEAMKKEKSCENCMFMKKHNNKCYCYETIYPKKCPAKFICGGWQLKNKLE